MTQSEHDELLRDLSSVTYTHIRFSGLYRELTTEQWERLAKEHAEKMLGLLERLVDEEFTRIEDEKENMYA